MRDEHQTLARVAASQYGLLSNRQIASATGCPSSAQRLVRTGLLERRQRGVYAMFGTLPRWEADLMTVVLSAPRLVAGSHRAAIRLWGLRSIDDEIEVSVRYPGDLRSDRAIVHRSRDLTEHDVTFIEGVPVTSMARTLCDAGLIFGETEVVRMGHHALAKGVLTPAELQRYRERVGRRGRTGVGAIDRLLASLPPGVDRADSGPEIEMASLVQRYDLPAPVWQHPVVARGNRYVLDFAYPEQRLAIEYDEYLEHTRPEKWAADKQRQNDLVEVGWTVIRFAWTDLRDRPDAVARRIRSFLVL
ncbi:MAG: DUF559 domain-containing protein [Acidimicrobiales bacterium]|nr:DUF559 domain-containing protein [Acidimicrobiales bacterium]